jgi:cytochrome c nitrite reductase small subunit
MPGAPENRQGFSVITLLAVLGGAALGIGLFTFTYAKGGSYLTNDPAACANCHVMNEQYAGWMKGSHRAAATCNDCHAPHDTLNKYYTKALNGFFHSWAFTTGRYQDHMRITSRNRRVTEQTCLGCHGELTSSIQHARGADAGASCLACHHEVGHKH